MAAANLLANGSDIASSIDFPNCLATSSPISDCSEKVDLIACSKAVGKVSLNAAFISLYNVF